MLIKTYYTKASQWYVIFLVLKFCLRTFWNSLDVFLLQEGISSTEVWGLSVNVTLCILMLILVNLCISHIHSVIYCCFIVITYLDCPVKHWHLLGGQASCKNFQFVFYKDPSLSFWLKIKRCKKISKSHAWKENVCFFR